MIIKNLYKQNKKILNAIYQEQNLYHKYCYFFFHELRY